MARTASGAFNVSKMKSMFAEFRTHLDTLQKRKAELQGELAEIESVISQFGGSSPVANGSTTAGKRRGRPPGSKNLAKTAAANGSAPKRDGRVKNEMSLVASLEKVLGESSDPLSVGDIMTKVQGLGYKSSSPNFRGIINQTLIKEKKRFGSAGRGMYQMKT